MNKGNIHSMIVLACTILGASLGIYLAKRNGGVMLDAVQYAASTGIAFALMGLIVTIIIHRSMLG